MRRLMLTNANSRYCKELGSEEGIFISLGDVDDIRPLGKFLHVRPVDWSAKAVDFSGEKPVSVYDEEDALFQEIRDRPAARDMQCMYGVELLLQVGSEQMMFFCGSKTLRRAAPPLLKALHRDVLISSAQMDFKQFRWYTFKTWYSGDDADLRPRYVPDNDDYRYEDD